MQVLAQYFIFILGSKEVMTSIDNDIFGDYSGTAKLVLPYRGRELGLQRSSVSDTCLKAPGLGA